MIVNRSCSFCNWSRQVLVKGYNTVFGNTIPSKKPIHELKKNEHDEKIKHKELTQ